VKFRLLTFLFFLAVSGAGTEDLHRYFISPAYVRTFNHVEAHIWILINRIPELRWKTIEIPPFPNSHALLPSTVLVHGNFQKEGTGPRSLVVNGTKVKVSPEGEFILKVQIPGKEFGLLVSLREFDGKEEVKQTIGFRITSGETKKKSISSRVPNFLGNHVFNQRKIASLVLPSLQSQPEFPVADQSQATVEIPLTTEKLDHFELYFGASFANYEQNNAYRQSPKTTFVRFNYERNLKPVFSSPIWVGFDSRFSILPIGNETGGSLQFLNPEIKVGLTVFENQNLNVRLFTGTNYFTSFGNQSLGFYGGLGQSLVLDAKWLFSSGWTFEAYTKATVIPPSRPKGNPWTSGEVLGGITVSHRSWGLFSEFAKLHLNSAQEVDLSAARFGFFTQF